LRKENDIGLKKHIATAAISFGVFRVFLSHRLSYVFPALLQIYACISMFRVYASVDTVRRIVRILYVQFP